MKLIIFLLSFNLFAEVPTNIVIKSLVKCENLEILKHTDVKKNSSIYYLVYSEKVSINPKIVKEISISLNIKKIDNINNLVIKSVDNSYRCLNYNYDGYFRTIRPCNLKDSINIKFSKVENQADLLVTTLNQTIINYSVQCK